MQERKLNYRPTWDLQKNYDRSNENITANYYPINSAIAIEDLDTLYRFTVMNDRAQGGSALQDGSIEFMQNRRIPADDKRGMGEFLDEMTTDGKEGLRV